MCSVSSFQDWVQKAPQSGLGYGKIQDHDVGPMMLSVSPNCAVFGPRQLWAYWITFHGPWYGACGFEFVFHGMDHGRKNHVGCTCVVTSLRQIKLMHQLKKKLTSKFLIRYGFE